MTGINAVRLLLMNFHFCRERQSFLCSRMEKWSISVIVCMLWLHFMTLIIWVTTWPYTQWATGTCKHLGDIKVQVLAWLVWWYREVCCYPAISAKCLNGSLHPTGWLTATVCWCEDTRKALWGSGEKNGARCPRKGRDSGTGMVLVRFRSGSNPAPVWGGHICEPVPKLAAIWVIAWGREGPLSQMWRPQECHPKTCHLHPAERDCSSAAISASLLRGSQPPLKWAEMKWTHSGTGAPTPAATLSI